MSGRRPIMRKLLLSFVLLTTSLYGRDRLQGWCQQGAISAIAGGFTATPNIQASYPSCTVTVYGTGTVNLSVIYADNAGTPKANPFTAASSGIWFFYADTGRYDVRFSGGGISVPFTLGDYVLYEPTESVSTTTANTFGAGKKQTFTPSATTAGARIISGADPSALVQGDLIINGDDFKWRGSTITEVAERISRRNAASGYAGLDGSSKLTASQGQEVWNLVDLLDVASKRGTSTQVQLTTGSTATDDCAKFDVNGNLVSSGVACSALPAGAVDLQFLRRKANQTSTIYEWASEPVILASDHNFPAQTPGGSLTIGSNTVTLTPCPLGVAGANTNHYLYISGGTGAAEAVLLTGGTCTSGAATGTVIFSAANTHSGAWTMGSATGGLQEALKTLISAGVGEVRLNQGATLYAPVTVGAGVFTISGPSRYAQLILRHSSFTNNDLIICAGSLTVKHVAISVPAGVAGPYASIRAGTGCSLVVSDVQIVNGAYGLLNDSASSFRIHGLDYINTDTTNQGLAGIKVDCSGATPSNVLISDSIITGSPLIDATILQKGLDIRCIDGMIVNNVWFGGAQIPIHLQAGTGKPILNIYINQVLVDQFTRNGIQLTGTGTVGFSSIRVANSHINGQHITGSQYGILMDGNPDDVQITGNNIQDCGRDGIYVNVTGTKSILISNNRIGNNDAAAGGYVGIRLAASAAGVQILSNVIGNVNAGVVATQDYAIWIAGNVTDIAITGNDVSQNPGTAVIGGTFTGLIGDNKGLDDLPVPTIASATSISSLYFGTPFSMIKITGTVTITTITDGWLGRKITLIFTNASPGGLGTGGNIARAQSVVQYQSVTLQHDGANWF